MIKIYPAESRYTANHGWLTSRFSFSFAEYFDPDNLRFGTLRVLNDDIIQPGTGFDTHPHNEMEIVTIMLSGQLLHKDSTGHTQVLRPGEIQRMSAGTGIYHSEWNASDEEEACLLQLWIQPQQRGLTPSYEQIAYDQEKMVNQLLPIVSPEPLPQTALIHQDAVLYLCKLESGHNVDFQQEKGRRIFFFVIEGDASLNEDVALHARDSARIEDTAELKIETKEGAYLLLIDLP